MGREPAMVLAVISAALALLVLYGFISGEQSKAWEALIVALLPLIQGIITRRLVMPVSRIKDAGLEPRDVSAAAKQNTGR